MKIINFRATEPKLLVIQPAIRIDGREVIINYNKGIFHVSTGCQKDIQITKDNIGKMISEITRGERETKVFKCICSKGSKSAAPSVEQIVMGWVPIVLEETDHVYIDGNLHAWAKSEYVIVEVEHPGAGEYFSYINQVRTLKKVKIEKEVLLYKNYEIPTEDSRKILSMLNVMSKVFKDEE